MEVIATDKTIARGLFYSESNGVRANVEVDNDNIIDLGTWPTLSAAFNGVMDVVLAESHTNVLESLIKAGNRLMVSKIGGSESRFILAVGPETDFINTGIKFASQAEAMRAVKKAEDACKT